MAMIYTEYRARKIVNIHKHVDGAWFWDKYSAHPYIGCRHDCAFCYTRGGKYLGGRDPETFGRQIKVKINAAELLRKELTGKTRDIVACGDWQQPAETRYRLSRAMLEVLLELGFPLLVVERSPFILRDLDLLTAIDQKTWAGVVFSISSMDTELKNAFEPRSPGIKKRLKAMETLAANGITVGTAMMPILPCIGDDEGHLAETIRATKDHGGRFVLAGGLTMDGVQADRTLDAYRQLAPELEPALRYLYQWPAAGPPGYGPPHAYGIRLGLKVRELCIRHGLGDRMPRYVAPGPLAVNHRLAERLFLMTYNLELEGAANPRIWACRKAAWTVDEWPENIAELHRREGATGLRRLPGIGAHLAKPLTQWLDETSAMDPNLGG